MRDKYISSKEFSTLPSEEQNRLMREYVLEMPVEERRVLKKLIENETNKTALP